MPERPTPVSVFGEEAGKIYLDVLEKLQRFGTLTGALPGDDNIKHLLAQHERFHKEWFAHGDKLRAQREKDKGNG